MLGILSLFRTNFSVFIHIQDEKAVEFDAITTRCEASIDATTHQYH